MEIDFLRRGYSSVVEHSTADREVPSSNLGAPWKIWIFCWHKSKFFKEKINRYFALPGNRTQVSRMGILNDTITPAVPAPLTEKDGKRDIFGRKKMTFFKRKKKLRCEQGSNLCGNIPLDFESNALTTRPSQQVSKRGSRCRMDLSFVHKVGSISGWFTLGNWNMEKNF